MPAEVLSDTQYDSRWLRVEARLTGGKRPLAIAREASLGWQLPT